jgi:hypothetical protein
MEMETDPPTLRFVECNEIVGRSRFPPSPSFRLSAFYAFTLDECSGPRSLRKAIGLRRFVYLIAVSLSRMTW